MSMKRKVSDPKYPVLLIVQQLTLSRGGSKICRHALWREHEKRNARTSTKHEGADPSYVEVSLTWKTKSAKS